MFSARGIDADGFNIDFENVFIKKRVRIRGVGQRELVYVIKEEYDGLPKEVQANFIDV